MCKLSKNLCSHTIIICFNDRTLPETIKNWYKTKSNSEKPLPSKFKTRVKSSVPAHQTPKKSLKKQALPTDTLLQPSQPTASNGIETTVSKPDTSQVLSEKALLNDHEPTKNEPVNLLQQSDQPQRENNIRQSVEEDKGDVTSAPANVPTNNVDNSTVRTVLSEISSSRMVIHIDFDGYEKLFRFTY